MFSSRSSSHSHSSEEEKSQHPRIDRPATIGSEKNPPIDLSSRPPIGFAASSTRDMFPTNIIDVDNILPASARSNWNVEDASLRPMPPLHPPMDRQCTVFVGDASPSVIAARVSDCLRRRSIVVEYDDETATARAVTSDRVRFLIRMYRGGSNSGPSSPFSHGVIVECTRTRGCPMTFHRACRAILSSAQGEIDGIDYINPLIPISGVEGIPPLPSEIEESKQGTTQALMGLEIAWSLLKKDRVDANVIGMESLVFLTEERSSGRGLALIAGLAVLGEARSDDDEEGEEDARFVEIHQSIISLVRDRRLLGADALIDDEDSEDEEKLDTFDDDPGSNFDRSSMSMARQPAYQNPEDIEHVSTLRTLALRALGNSLEIVAEHRGSIMLNNVIPRLVEEEDIIPSLIDEIGDAIIPENQAFNAHDAALAARILRILVQNSSQARQRALASNALNILEKAKLIGGGRHAVLEQEAELASQALRNTPPDSGAAVAAAASPSAAPRD
eukprot:CAMPEP_0172479774 /NCGR_PEP_ID=MMETSP1066-20121228/4583_1 /TAXON_ID=671091 /ORGANISM="Coscinodiscus wailesii, Strain CCMP2513" /LENGTH=501 /DNA_ID=CAMNT_0013240543 /DNA_START=262 /DNA_END=1767 /DNA_ORIENTATION=+